MNSFLFAFVVLSLIQGITSQCNITSPSLSGLFPLPANVQCGNQLISLAPQNSFEFEMVGPVSSSLVMDIAFVRYKETIYGLDDFPYKPEFPQLTTVQVSIQSKDFNLTLGVDESYQMTIQAPVTKITSNTIWGALRALETFTQLISFETNFTIYDTPLTIQDSPRFPWRGVMIDTSRHYLPVELILHIIDGLAIHKFNVLHWHLVDEVSFPFVVDDLPLLSGKGAWHKNLVYEASDIEQIVTYAYFRGVRVVPEIDMPSHTRSWGKGYPQVMPNCSEATFYNYEPGLDPSDPFTFTVVQGIISQLVSLFPDQYFHRGGDEVFTECYQEDSQLLSWMNQNGMGSNFTLLLQYFEKNLAPIISVTGKSVVCWSDVIYYSNHVDKENTIVTAWRERGDAQTIASLGYKTINSAGWYLDMQIPGQEHYEWIATWEDFYDYDPTQNMTASELALFYGGESCMWGEAVDRINWDQRVWPRGSALAERLWSPANLNDLDYAKNRLVQFRCQTLVRRGFYAEPILPDYCSYEYDF
eukprot:TRINITY_DN1055_c0_g1_i3.p1 TRINITY_DN1055_c0_g1~~TRINITY_DN1055_c0_g1_i3.p1  ORF type:complete len:528 (-),score=102.21 TRINITY_DN1055_c0_g1_i3:92-1675(-)